MLCNYAVIVTLLYVCFNPQRMSAVPQPETDFLNGNLHRKHPGITNLKTLRLPEELRVATLSIIQSMSSC